MYSGLKERSIRDWFYFNACLVRNALKRISGSGRAKTWQGLLIPITRASTNCTGKRNDKEDPEATASWPIPIASSHLSKRSRRSHFLRVGFFLDSTSSRVDFVARLLVYRLSSRTFSTFAGYLLNFLYAKERLCVTRKSIVRRVIFLYLSGRSRRYTMQ